MDGWIDVWSMDCICGSSIYHSGQESRWVSEWYWEELAKVDRVLIIFYGMGIFTVEPGYSKLVHKIGNSTIFHWCFPAILLRSLYISPILSMQNCTKLRKSYFDLVKEEPPELNMIIRQLHIPNTSLYAFLSVPILSSKDYDRTKPSNNRSLDKSQFLRSLADLPNVRVRLLDQFGLSHTQYFHLIQ